MYHYLLITLYLFSYSSVLAQDTIIYIPDITENWEPGQPRVLKVTHVVNDRIVHSFGKDQYLVLKSDEGILIGSTMDKTGMVTAKFELGLVPGCDTIRIIDPIELTEELKLVHYVRAKPHGPYEKYYPDGKIAEQGVYDEGDPLGVIQYFYPSGKLKKKVDHSSKDVHERTTSYYENSNIKEVAGTRSGHLYGEYLEYHENGKLKVKGTYDYIGGGDTIRVIDPITLEEKTEITSPTNTAKSGTWKYYNEKGKLIRKEEY